MEVHGPSRERAAIEQRRERLEKLGYFSISMAGVIAVALVLGLAGYYKMLLFGPEVLVWSAVVALIIFVLLASSLLGYSKFFLTQASGENKADPADTPLTGSTTNRLLADKPIDEFPSVTEHSTELLERLPRKRRGSTDL